MPTFGLRNQQREHWEKAWAAKPATANSWYQDHPALSLAMIAATGIGREEPLIDIGGGASTLIDALLQDGWRDVTVLDISATALAAVRRRLGAIEARATWLNIDLFDTVLMREYSLWHDRAVFHFLTEPGDRLRYRALAESSLCLGGQLIIGSFDEDGPEKCSGLNVQRHSSASLISAMGPAFELLEIRREVHRTPLGAAQNFIYGRFLHRGRSPV